MYAMAQSLVPKGEAPSRAGRQGQLREAVARGSRQSEALGSCESDPERNCIEEPEEPRQPSPSHCTANPLLSTCPQKDSHSVYQDGVIKAALL